ncbi:MAG: protein kinase, partial [Deltaproteobacteria bacterium]|nr:protein kinase [Deltaproteobacteria bacterium]
LGAGGMGVVYLAHDEQRGLDVALKVLPEGLSAADVERLKREFRTLADVSHPNLVALHELVVDDAHCFFTMERIDGVELVDWMAQAADERTSSPSLSRWTPGSGPLRTPRSDETTAPSGRAAVAESAGASDGASSELLPQRADLDRLRSALRQLADALVTLHAADRLHLDLKPSNVLVRRDGRVVVLDFGIARTVSGDDDSMVTDDLSISGTPAYMAPEQAMGERVTAAADWYAVGTMLFAALTGRLPFTGAIASVLLAKQMKTAPRPSTFVSGIPEDLDDLVHRLLARAPETRPTGLDVLAWCGRGETSPGVVPSMAPPSARAPFVGRTELLAALDAALVAPRAGHPVVVWVGGRSGMGKTALVQQFLARARRRSSAPVVLTGRCYERESVPFKAFDGIADALARHLSRLARADVAALLPPDAHELAKVFPVMTRVEALRDLPRRRRDIPDPHELRTRGFRALKQTLATLAQRAPLVAVVDDLQWSDADSVLLLAELLCAPGAPQMLLVGTYRSDERATNALLAELLDVPARSGVDLRAIDVGPLEPDEAADLARRLVEQTASLHDADVASLVRESNGSPLFVAELVRHATTGAGDAPAAASLDELLLGRVRNLDAPSRALLELVALAGGPVEQGVVLRAAAEREPDDLAGALAVLKGASLVRTRGGRPTDAVECFHDRVRETVAARVDPERRALLFGRLGDALERSGRADPEQLAETYRRAGALDRAARHVERAADAAAAALAFDRAARLYAEALETGAREPEATRSLQRRLGDALANAGRSRRAAEAYVQAAADLQTPDALELRRLAAEHYMVSGHLDEGSRLLDGLLAEVDLPRISSTTRAVASILWRRTRNVLRGSAWRERSEQEVAAAELRRIDVCLTAALGYSSIDPIRGAAYVATLLGLALDAGEPRRVATALAFDGMMSATGGPPGAARAEELLGSAAALCERIDSPFATAFTTMMRGVAAWCMGRFREGATLAERSETLLRETCTGVMSHVDRAHDFVLVNRVALGDLPGVRV